MYSREKEERNSINKFEVEVARDSKEDNDANRERTDTATTSRPSGYNEESASSNKIIAEKKQEKNVESRGDTNTEVKSDAKVFTSENEKTIDKGNDILTANSQEAGPSVKPKKKKKKSRRRKSALDISGNESITIANSEEHTLVCSNPLTEHDRTLIAQRINAIESGESNKHCAKLAADMLGIKPADKTIGKRTKGHGKSRRENLKNESPNSNEIVQNSEDNRINAFSNKSCVDHPHRKVICVQQKFTQTDPLPEYPSLSKPSDGRNTKILRLKSDGASITKLKEPALPIQNEVLNLKRQYSESRRISEANEPIFPIPIEDLNLEMQDSDSAIINEGKQPDTSIPLEIPVLNADIRGAVGTGIVEAKELILPLPSEKLNVKRENSDSTEIPEVKEPALQTPLEVIDLEIKELDNTGIAGATESDLLIPFEELNLERYDSDSTAISEIKEQALQIPLKVIGAEIVPKYIDIQKKSGSILNAFDQELLSIKEGLLRDIKIASEKYLKGYKNCFKRTGDF